MPAVMTGAVGVGGAVRHENGHMTVNMGHVNRKPVASMPQSLHTRRVFDGRSRCGDRSDYRSLLAIRWSFFTEP